MAQDFVITTAYFGSSFRPVSRALIDPAEGPFSWLDMDGAIWSLTRSPYFVKLGQYGVGQILQSKNDVGPYDPPAEWFDAAQGFTDHDLEMFVETEVDAQRLPPADSWGNVRPLYLMILAKGLCSADHPGDAGFHWTFNCRGTRAMCAWVVQSDSLHDTTEIVSREIVASATSERGTADLTGRCKGITGLVHGVMVQAYLSRDERDTCVIPGELRIDLRWDEARQHAETAADQARLRADDGSRTSG